MTSKADPTEFAGKRVLISGGTKGLGRATVNRFLAGGARVITSARGALDPIDGVEFVQADLTTAEGGEVLARAALERLGELDPRQAQVVELRAFSGMTMDEIAAALDLSLSTVEREWRAARAWLRRELGPSRRQGSP